MNGLSKNLNGIEYFIDIKLSKQNQVEFEMKIKKVYPINSVIKSIRNDLKQLADNFEFKDSANKIINSTDEEVMKIEEIITSKKEEIEREGPIYSTLFFLN